MLTTRKRKERRLKQIALKVASGAYLSPEDIDTALKTKIAQITNNGKGYELADYGRSICYEE